MVDVRLRNKRTGYGGMIEHHHRAHRVIRLLRKHGVLDEDRYDDFAEDEPLLAGMTSASIMGLVSTGDRAGRRVRRVLSDPTDAVRTGPLCFASSGFSLHAATRIAGGDKAGLERLCKYVSRPPLAHGSLQVIPCPKTFSFVGADLCVRPYRSEEIHRHCSQSKGGHRRSAPTCVFGYRDHTLVKVSF
jgi:hypothetical protein